MNPVHFKESNCTLTPPAKNMECENLYVFRDGRSIISKWRLNFWERLQVAFLGYVWVIVLAQETHAPIALTARRTMFITQKTWINRRINQMKEMIKGVTNP